MVRIGIPVASPSQHCSLELVPCQVVGAPFRMKTHDTGWGLFAFIEGDKAGEAGHLGRGD